MVARGKRWRRRGWLVLAVALVATVVVAARGGDGHLAGPRGDVAASAAPQPPASLRDEAAVRAALEAHFRALEARDTAAAGAPLREGFFYIAPWGALEFRDEMLGRYREAFRTGRLRNYRVELRAFRSGPAGEGARWFRVIVREKYERESERSARGTASSEST